MNGLHIVEEVIGIERDAYMVANLFGYTQVGTVVTAYPVGVHGIGVVGTYHQLRQVIEQHGVVVLCPKEGLGKRYAFVRIVPGGVVLRINGYILVLGCSVIGSTRVLSVIGQNDSPAAS
jgi:hypothetical protein